jgi:hypothetical protein
VARAGSSANAHAKLLWGHTHGTEHVRLHQRVQRSAGDVLHHSLEVDVALAGLAVALAGWRIPS